MKWFDYIFYRIAQSYLMKWKDDTGIFTGIAILTLSQFLFLLTFGLVLSHTSNFKIPYLNKYYIWLICLSGLVLNSIRYKKFITFKMLEQKYANENNAKKNGILVVVYLILMFLLPVLYGVIKHNIIGGKSIFD